MLGLGNDLDLEFLSLCVFLSTFSLLNVETLSEGSSFPATSSLTFPSSVSLGLQSSSTTCIRFSSTTPSSTTGPPSNQMSAPESDACTPLLIPSPSFSLTVPFLNQDTCTTVFSSRFSLYSTLLPVDKSLW
ncbi:hypothetical protein GEMRC1_003966 [Eukaryota sp. GEM-RC1]